MTDSAVISQSSPRSARAYALDALRGLAILAMLLSGQLPFDNNSLPAWMYHAQVPPPRFEFDPHVYGITWVDLVFPIFLFSMGAAFPLALARRMDQGMSKGKLALFIGERGFLLGFFALYVQAIRPYVLNHHPTMQTHFAALLGFFLLFPILTRLPDKWPPSLRWTIRIAGWVGAILFLIKARMAENPAFVLDAKGINAILGRSDIIIIVLANMAVFGSLVWMLTRNQLLPRLGILGILLAIRLSNMPEPLEGWVSELWKMSPAPWIYHLYYLQYLCIVIPGTIAGDLILQWTRAATVESESRRWPGIRLLVMALLMLVFVLVLLIGLKSRWLVPTTLITFVLCALGCWLFQKPGNATERLYKQLFFWAVYWLVLGLVFEPYEGGIRKDKATVSYYFVTSGLAICVFIGFSILIDVFKRRSWVQFLIDNGQNPMIAYAGINNFIGPVLALTSVNGLLTQFSTTPWRGFGSGLTITLLMGITVSILTRCKIFWRT